MGAPCQARTCYRYEEDVVAHAAAGGGLRVLPDWPSGVLPALPAGARYDPGARIVRGTPGPPSRAILEISP